jgi:hypothetical protein
VEITASPVAPQSVLLPTPWCVIREQESSHLLYNPRTDELHLIPPTGFYAYRLCDGVRTVSEVTAEVAAACGVEVGEVSHRVGAFLADLLARGLLEAEP